MDDPIPVAAQPLEYATPGARAAVLHMRDDHRGVVCCIDPPAMRELVIRAVRGGVAAAAAGLVGVMLAVASFAILGLALDSVGAATIACVTIGGLTVLVSLSLWDKAGIVTYLEATPHVLRWVTRTRERELGGECHADRVAAVTVERIRPERFELVVHRFPRRAIRAFAGCPKEQLAAAARLLRDMLASSSRPIPRSVSE